jgi:hypothetical protein
MKWQYEEELAWQYEEALTALRVENERLRKDVIYLGNRIAQLRGISGDDAALGSQPEGTCGQCPHPKECAAAKWCDRNEAIQPEGSQVAPGAYVPKVSVRGNSTLVEYVPEVAPGADELTTLRRRWAWIRAKVRLMNIYGRGQNVWYIDGQELARTTGETEFEEAVDAALQSEQPKEGVRHLTTDEQQMLKRALFASTKRIEPKEGG